MLDQTTLKNLFDYQDGKLLWKERTSKRKNKGKLETSYVAIVIEG